jgi:hypothetical protein
MNDMSDQEKSVLLAKVAQLEIEYEPIVLMGLVQTHTRKETIEYFVPDLYDPTNMYLAWRVHLWALEARGIRNPYWNFWANSPYVWILEDAQRLWLDKILELAIEAGIVEVEA